jgi:hypothetical protein
MSRDATRLARIRSMRFIIATHHEMLGSATETRTNDRRIASRLMRNIRGGTKRTLLAPPLETMAHVRQ